MLQKILCFFDIYHKKVLIYAPNAYGGAYCKACKHMLDTRDIAYIKRFNAAVV